MRCLVIVLILGTLFLPALLFAADKAEEIDIEGIQGRRYKIALNRSMSAIAQCYNDALKKNQALSGKLAFRVTVNPNGQTKSVEVLTDTLGDTAVTDCTTKLLQGKTWPESDAPVYFENVFTFAPAPAADK